MDDCARIPKSNIEFETKMNPTSIHSLARLKYEFARLIILHCGKFYVNKAVRQPFVPQHPSFRDFANTKNPFHCDNAHHTINWRHGAFFPNNSRNRRPFAGSGGCSNPSIIPLAKKAPLGKRLAVRNQVGGKRERSLGFGKLKPQQGKHSPRISRSQLPVAVRGEMQMVRPAGTTL